MGETFPPLPGHADLGPGELTKSVEVIIHAPFDFVSAWYPTVTEFGTGNHRRDPRVLTEEGLEQSSTVIRTRQVRNNGHFAEEELHNNLPASIDSVTRIYGKKGFFGAARKERGKLLTVHVGRLRLEARGEETLLTHTTVTYGERASRDSSVGKRVYGREENIRRKAFEMMARHAEEAYRTRPLA